MKTKCELDDVGNAVAVHALPLLIFERVGVATCSQEPLLEMVGANNSEMLRSNRLAVLAHRRQQLGDTGPVDLVGTEELSQ